jgi:2-oxoisovalerate dehydrogenase E1 component
MIRCIYCVLQNAELHIESLKAKAAAGQITIGDAINLAVLEEMIRDPSTTIHAEDLQAGSSYDIPKLTQQTFGKVCSCSMLCTCVCLWRVVL